MTDIAKLKALAEAQVGFRDMSLAPDVVLELIAEIQRHQGLYDHMKSMREAYGYESWTEVLTVAEQLKAENEELRKDAERYRYFSGRAWSEGRDGGWAYHYRFPCVEKTLAPCGGRKGFHYDTVDDAIDAAMAQEQKP